MTTTLELPVKEPVFEKDNLKTPICTYLMFKQQGVIPPMTSDEYGLYKYGEWLRKNGIWY